MLAPPGEPLVRRLRLVTLAPAPPPPRPGMTTTEGGVLAVRQPPGCPVIGERAVVFPAGTRIARADPLVMRLPGGRLLYEGAVIGGRAEILVLTDLDHATALVAGGDPSPLFDFVGHDGEALVLRSVD